MNRRLPGLLITKAVEGFGQFKQAEGLSARTVESYSRYLENWLTYQSCQDVTTVKKEQLRNYLTYLLTDNPQDPEWAPGGPASTLGAYSSS